MSDRGSKPKKARQKPVTSGDPVDAGSFPISTRLSEAQKQWVEEAAKLKGWTPANFIRQAAVEKAVHLLNISRRNKFDFDSTAAMVAKQLCEPEILVEDENGREQIADDEFHDHMQPMSVSTERISTKTLHALNEAVRLGGAEFMATVLDRCTRILGPASGTELPDPIEPE